MVILMPPTVSQRSPRVAELVSPIRAASASPFPHHHPEPHPKGSAGGDPAQDVDVLEGGAGVLEADLS